MQDILTITLNPAVDVSTSTGHVRDGQKLRCTPVQTDPGGGGINVSRAIHILGGQSRALVAIGGPTGKKLRHLLRDQGIAYVPFRAPGETRQSLAVTDQSNGAQYRFVMPGPVWDGERQRALMDMLDDIASDDGLVVLSGSLPLGVVDHFALEVSRHVAQTHARLIADVSGPALRCLVSQPPNTLFALRMDQLEAETLAQRTLADRADTASFAKSLCTRGVAEIVLIARGADGNVMATPDGVWHAAAPNVPVVSKVGAGDSFVGAFTLSLARAETLEHALVYATAAASAAVMTHATHLCTRADTDLLLSKCPVTRL